MLHHLFCELAEMGVIGLFVTMWRTNNVTHLVKEHRSLIEGHRLAYRHRFTEMADTVWQLDEKWFIQWSWNKLGRELRYNMELAAENNDSSEFIRLWRTLGSIEPTFSGPVPTKMNIFLRSINQTSSYQFLHDIVFGVGIEELFGFGSTLHRVVALALLDNGKYELAQQLDPVYHRYHLYHSNRSDTEQLLLKVSRKYSLDDPLSWIHIMKIGNGGLLRRFAGIDTSKLSSAYREHFVRIICTSHQALPSSEFYELVTKTLKKDEFDRNCLRLYADWGYDYLISLF